MTLLGYFYANTDEDWEMTKKEFPAAELAAMIVQRLDGRWEVKVSDQLGSEGMRSWRHRRMCRTEQEAEQFARSILPYNECWWDQRPEMYTDSPDVVRVKRPETTRRSRHRPVW